MGRESIILIPVPSAESMVRKWRKKYDPVAIHGVPAHITVVYPFKNPEIIDERIRGLIKEFFSGIKQFDFRLTRINTFPGVIYLEPEPRNTFVKLVEGIVKIFPENQWFAGKFKGITPHLTIGNKLQNLESVKNEISQDISSKLPINSIASEAWLMESRDGEWSVREKYYFVT